ncbi:hypothetical protein [Photobacterium minamisatsumaniensis]|uniref:hypothetical protein n=1 Tax=Photobacterium minamisatsumaniensis TaxID=2910233 RepID=UPI003D0F5D58
MNFETMSDTALWDIANPLMDNLIEGSTEINHAKHVHDFTQRMREIVSPEYFDMICKQYQQEKGFFTHREPVAIFRRPDSVAFIWKQSFTKVQGEFVAEIVLVYRNNRLLIDHTMIF